MKKVLLFFIPGLMLLLSSCSSNSDLVSATANYPKVPASFVKSKNLTGTLKGTLKQDSTYYLTGNVAVAKGDTLAIQAGATIIAKGNFQFQVSGTLLSLGTEAKQVTFTSQDASRFTDFATYTGHWGGFVFDSTAVYVYVKYTHINFTGGPDSSGSPQASFDVEGSQTYNGGAYIVLEDSWFYGGVDDGIHLAGNITASIKRNVLQRLGGPDGETMNIKKGVKGDIAYNYIWSAANNAIKLETGSILVPQTSMNIFNNTIVDGGNLIGTVQVNPCTQALEKRTYTDPCNLTSASDVPGPIQTLCWDLRLEPWYPMPRYTMNTGAEKWPTNQKNFNVAYVPKLVLYAKTSNSVTLTWTYCFQVQTYILYQNGANPINVSGLTPYTVSGLTTGRSYSFYIVAAVTNAVSGPSNTVQVTPS